jgi:hypothetical protein
MQTPAKQASQQGGVKQHFGKLFLTGRIQKKHSTAKPATANTSLCSSCLSRLGTWQRSQLARSCTRPCGLCMRLAPSQGHQGGSGHAAGHESDEIAPPGILAWTGNFVEKGSRKPLILALISMLHSLFPSWSQNGRNSYENSTSGADKG